MGSAPGGGANACPTDCSHVWSGSSADAPSACCSSEVWLWPAQDVPQIPQGQIPARCQFPLSASSGGKANAGFRSAARIAQPYIIRPPDFVPYPDLPSTRRNSTRSYVELHYHPMHTKKPSRYHRTDIRILYSQLDDAIVQRGRHPRPDGVEGQALHPSRLGLELGQHGGGRL